MFESLRCPCIYHVNIQLQASANSCLGQVSIQQQIQWRKQSHLSPLSKIHNYVTRHSKIKIQGIYQNEIKDHLWHICATRGQENCIPFMARGQDVLIDFWFISWENFSLGIHELNCANQTVTSGRVTARLVSLFKLYKISLSNCTRLSGWSLHNLTRLGMLYFRNVILACMSEEDILFKYIEHFTSKKLKKKSDKKLW